MQLAWFARVPEKRHGGLGSDEDQVFVTGEGIECCVDRVRDPVDGRSSSASCHASVRGLGQEVCTCRARDARG